MKSKPYFSKLITILLLTVCNLQLNAQDTIIKYSQDTIFGKVLRADSLKIFYNQMINNESTNKWIRSSEVQKIIYARKNTFEYNKKNSFSIGLGLGLDYSGIGINVLFYANKNVGIFFSYGIDIKAAFNFAHNSDGTKNQQSVVSCSDGWMTGIKYRLIKNVQTSNWLPYFTGYYGTNTNINLNVGGINIKDKGFSIGAGYDFHKNFKKKNHMSLGINYAIRSKEAKDKLQNYQIYILPISISYGIRF